ncbi:MAG: Omp28-related outer membrane protein [Chitinophagales bacterium]|nr:Omp28-related outer membrane protein [Chitinophagales bacterium]
MRKFCTLFIALLLVAGSVYAQVEFKDNFDNYKEGEYLGLSGGPWTTWGGAPGSSEDVKITNKNAKSPENSIFIEGKNPTGGPMDVVLPFGVKYSSGTFVYGMSMFIPDNKQAYFNFQANLALGAGVSPDATFSRDGILQFKSGEAVVLTTWFPHEQWFDLKVEISFTANIWAVSIDDECRGSFSNSSNSVASVDLYPINDQFAFYVDDVYYAHNPATRILKFDAGLTDFVWDAGKVKGDVGNPTFLLKNFGEEQIKSASIAITQDGEELDFYEIEGLDIAKGKSEIIYIPDVTLKGGINNITATLLKINGEDVDDEPCNNILSFVINAIDPTGSRTVLVEEATGTWCAWCPRGAVFMDRLSAQYKGLFIPVAVHGGSPTEPMRLVEYEKFLGFAAFPNCRVNRINKDLDPSEAEQPFLEEIVKPAEAKFVIGAQYNESNKTLDVGVEVEFLESASGKYYLSLILTEDNVRGTSSGYSQANAYAGGGAGPMGGYESLPNPVPASLMVYNHVARAVSGLQQNENNKIEGTFEKGDKQIVRFSIPMSAEWKQEDMHIIPVLLKSGRYINAGTTTIAEAKENVHLVAVKETVLAGGVSIYPNPASTMVHIECSLSATSPVNVEVYNMDGKLQMRKDFGAQSGVVQLNMPVQMLNTGMYLFKVKTAEGSKFSKVFIER